MMRMKGSDLKALIMQVRVAVFGPIVAVQTLIWIYVGAWARSVNPEHAGPPLTT